MAHAFVVISAVADRRRLTGCRGRVGRFGAPLGAMKNSSCLGRLGAKRMELLGKTEPRRSRGEFPRAIACGCLRGYKIAGGRVDCETTGR